MILGVDTGGTFTDIVALDDDGSVNVFKTPSTPRDPSQAILSAVQAVGPQRGFDLVHGTTVATNALLERRGAKAALLTTMGCRDVLAIGRQTRDQLYSLNPSARDPIISLALRFEVDERIDWRGEVVTPLDEASVACILDRALGEGVESLAVCFLFSFLRPEHERTVGRLALERGLSVSLSSEVAPEFREYERTATVCANAYVGPVLSRYVGGLARGLEHAGVRRLAIMQSNGGTLRAEEAAKVAVKTVLSGPAGGLIAASRVAASAGFPRVLTFDMGGTSTDVALINGGPRTIRTGEVAGIPLLTPMLDIHTVGAGGGSIARLDAGGALRVGPQSAGADPGPVCYGSGDELTVTDANVHLGRLPNVALLAGSIPLDIDRVHRRFDRLARRMGVTPTEVAEGIVAIANAHMARALRYISTERGSDPAGYSLASFGGAGGLHACDLAEMLRVERVIVPRHPGAFSALGLVLSAVKREAVRTLFAENNEKGLKRVLAAVHELYLNVESELAAESVARPDMRFATYIELQYKGQSYALPVGFRSSLSASVSAFHRAHRTRYGYSDRSAPVEVVAVGVTGEGPAHDLPEFSTEANGTECSSSRRVQLSCKGTLCSADLFHRAELSPGENVAGPAIIVQPDATTLISPGWSAHIDRGLNLLITPHPAAV